MKRKQRRTKRRLQAIPVWTYAQIKKAQPYVVSILRSLREHHVEAQGHDRALRLLAQRQGRPDRTAMIAHQEETEAAAKAKDGLQQALDELHCLSIFCLDPKRGEALVPFAHQNQLAWFVFDAFDPEPIRFWRFHTDPLDIRAPLTDAQKQPLPRAIVA